MKRIFTHLFVAVLLMLSSTSWAQTTAQTTLEAGKVYNFKSVGYSGKSMAAEGLNKTVIDDTALDDYTQLWYVDEGTVDGTYTLRNLGNGCYLQGAGSGTKWPFVEQPSNLYYQAAGTGFSLTANSGQNPTQQYWMHYGAGNGCVVGWDANVEASQWTVAEVEIDPQALQANWDEVELLNGASEKLAVYQTYLDNLFFDKSCTTPKKLLSTVSDIESDVDYRALPAGLQAMVKKVYLGEWSEKNIISEKLSWSSEHAKRFRVQLYEPYSYGERTNSMLGIYAHSNMNNPTGLVANQRNLLYVMVEGEIKEGARLYLQSLVGDGRIGDIGGVELTEGLNIIPYWSDGNQLFIQYVVNTYENGAKTGHKLSQYEPLKIHIQGGCINGCFDTVGDALNPADTDEDWDAYEERAHQYNFTVLGKYVMWHMPLVIDDSNADYYDLSECLGTDATSVKTAMGAWETMESAQRLMEGLLSEQEVNTIPNASRVFEYTGNDSDELYPSDYSEEYNNRSMAYSTKDGYFMFAADWSTHYASNTLDDVILNIATAGDPWGPSHEIGHTYQGPINLPSTSETSNNAIANVSNWFLGRTSSRLGSTQSLLEQYNNNTSFLGTDINSGNVWEKLMMYTKLWFYYHVTGHNKKFYPRLFEMLRRDPIAREKGVALSGNETMLKFYKYACMAAGEDLTDFFEVFGFFVPVDGTLSDDYGDFKTVMTQAEIDAAKAEVAAMAAEKGWKKNTAIIFIDDRIGTVYSHDGQTVLQPRGDGGKELGVLGSINDFDSNPNNDVAPLSGEYSYTISGNTITMQGATGGVGFIIYDADGNLVSFSNTYSFPLGEKAQAALASGTARVVVTTADIDAKPIEIHDANATQTQAELLEGLLSQVKELLGYEDVDGTKVGWYKSSALETLKKAYDAASAVYDAKELASYGGVYSVLYEEYNAVTTSPAAKTEFVDGRTYYLKNVESGRYMTVDGDNVMATTTDPTATSTASLWQINAGFYESFYSIKNQSTGTYIRQPQKENNDYVNSQQFVLTSSSQEFMFEEVSTGKFAIKDRGSKKYLNYHASGSKIATWGASNEGSQWEIVYLPTDETMEQRTALEDLVLQAQLLVDEVSNSEVVYEELPLQVTEPDGQYYLWTNAQDSYEGDIKYLIDNETGDTGGEFFHSDYHNSSKPAGYHYLEVYLGADNTNSIFKFAYTNRNNGSNHPDGIAVKVSNTKDDYQNGTIVYEVLSDLPQGQGKSWSSDVFATGEAYKYLHFKITADNTYWHMDEFDIYTPVVSIELFNDYSSIGEGVVKDVINAMMNNTILLSENDLTSEQLKEAYNELLDVYKKLLDAKSGVDNSALNAEKERLQALVNSATSLINECKVGDIVSSPAAEVAVAMQAIDPSAANYLYCNALYNRSVGDNNGDNCMNTAKLLDNDTETYLHTIPNDQNPDDNLDHYLRVDFGDNAENGMLKFAYHTRKVSSYKVFPKTIKIEGSNNLDEGFEGIETISSGLPSEANESYESAVIGNGKSYRYIRFMVTDTYAGRTTSDNAVYGQHQYFCLAEFDLWTATVDQLKVTLSGNCGGATETMVLNAYRAVQAAQKSLEMATTAEQLQTAYSVLEAAYTTLESAKNIVNTDALQKAYNDLSALYNEMADAEGNVNANYAPSALTNEKLVAVKTALDAAKAQLDAATTQDDIDAAKNELQALYNELRAVEDANVAETKDKEGLNNLINDATDLCNIINGNIEKNENYYAGVDGLAFDELSEALQAAQDAVSRYYLTEEQYTSVYNTLYSCYSATNAVVALDVAKDELNNLIATMQTKLEEVTVSGAVATGSLPLQVDNSSKSYYICTYPRATDDNGLGALIDEIDGVANTGTFAGTYWQPDSKITDAYSHYVEIDLGVNTVLEDFAIDYTTRYSGAEDSRPTGLKFYGSNDKEDYTELFSVTEGLPADENTKWEMSEPYKLEKNYRYIRVAVTSSHEGHCFNMSDFNLYSHCTATVNEFYSTSDIFDCLPAALREYCDAKEAVSAYLLSADYEMAKNELQAQIDELNSVIDSNVTGRTDLETLSSETDGLVTDVVAVKDEESVITMQCTDENAPYYLYCNADGTETNGDGDRAGVAALVGDNATNLTHLHTTYNNKAQDDDLDHYLRLDMGENEAMVSFKFRYTGRINNVINAPTKMLIEGSNDLENFDEIATLDIDVPESGTATYSTEDALGNGKAYRYIRFMVKDTKNHASNNGHPFFVLSQFAVTACKTIEVNENYALNLQLKTLATAYNEVYDANIMVADKTHYVKREAYETALDELQDAKNALSAAMLLKDLPVKLTTDVNNPVLYKIKINRSTTTVLEYDGATADATKQVAVADEYVGNKYQAWYFMQGTDTESNDDILILPYWNEGSANTALRLGAASTGNAAAAVWAVESGDESKTLQNWYITVDAGNTAEGWWNIRPQGKDNYFSNNGGVGNKMGFWNSSSDDGSEFQFILDETDYSLSDAYYALYNQYVACGGKAASGEVIGTYTMESATPYNDAYDNAEALLEAKNSTDEVYNDARTTLAEAYDALEYNGGLCRIRSAFTGGYSADNLVYVDAVNNPYFEDATDEDLSKYVWEFVPVKGGYHLKNLHTQSYLTAAPWGGQVVLGGEAAARLVTVDFLDNENGIVRLNVAGGYPLHAQNSGSKLVGYTGGLGTASAWYVEEIEDVTKIKYTVTMSATFSSVMLGYNAVVPEGVEAYNAEGVEDGYVTLVKVAEENGVIPANIPVILYRTDANTSKTFTYTRTEPVAPASTVLGGSLYQKFVKCDSDKDYYKLMIKGGEAKMYWMYKEFNASGESLGSTNDGGHIKCSANKIYMVLPQREQAASFGMRFKEPETTGVDEFGDEPENDVIYDLQGRKLTEITQPGFYIINGKKVYVK